MGDWCAYEMPVQHVIEEIWMSGKEEVDLEDYSLSYPYKLNFQDFTQIRKCSQFVRSIRRRQQARYPTVRDPPDHSVLLIKREEDLNSRRSRLSESSDGGSSSKSSNGRKQSSIRKPKDAGNSVNLKDKIFDFIGQTISGITRSIDNSENIQTPSTSVSVVPTHSNNNTVNSNTASHSRRGRRSSLETVSTYLSGDSGDIKSSCQDLVDVSDNMPKAKSKRNTNTNGQHRYSTRGNTGVGTSGAGPSVFHNPSVEEALILKFGHVVATPPTDVTCPICLEDFNSAEASSDDSVIELNDCKHFCHLACYVNMIKSNGQRSFLRCPSCMRIYGKKTGNQPPGKMTWMTQKSSLPGHANCGIIVITYSFSGGKQGPEHPNPGQFYHATGFPRVAYLPDNQDGQKVLRLLRKAFDRRLTFTIGTSVTTGVSNTITWNEIHHKTEITNHSGHGYPDPMYITNILSELESHGVVDD